MGSLGRRGWSFEVVVADGVRLVVGLVVGVRVGVGEDALDGLIFGATQTIRSLKEIVCVS